MKEYSGLLCMVCLVLALLGMLFYQTSYHWPWQLWGLCEFALLGLAAWLGSMDTRKENTK